MRLGRALLYGVPDIKWAADSCTVEELVERISKSKVGSQMAVTIHSGELSSLIEPSGIKMIQFLTDIFDGDVKWARATKNMGKFDLENPLINLIGCTTPDYIADLPIKIINHGFTSRGIFVYEDEPRFLNPKPATPDVQLVRDLINDLDYISQIRGEFLWYEGVGAQPEDEEGKPTWDPDYKSSNPDFRPSTLSVYSFYYRRIFSMKDRVDYRLQGYYGRKKIHLLKVAMLVAIAEAKTDSGNLVLRPRHIHGAWKMLNITERRLAKVFSAVGKYEHASDMERILGAIQTSGGMTAVEIMENNYAAAEPKKLEEILTALVRMKKIELHVDVKGGRTVYRPKGSAVSVTADQEALETEQEASESEEGA
jgi:hypothetical protein